MAISSITTGTSGIVLLVVILSILIVLIIYAAYLYKNRHNKDKNLIETDGVSFLDKQQDYSILDYSETAVPGLKTNIIQPPYHTDVKVKLIPTSQTQKQSIKYTELGEEQVSFESTEKNITDEVSSEEHSPNQTTFGRSVNTYREKISNLISKYRQNSNDSTDAEVTNERRIWKPEPTSVNRKTSSTSSTFHRLQRPDSMIFNEESLGRLMFTMYYSPSDEFLTLLLISGRQINSCDPAYAIRLPAVSIVVENFPNSEVTSNPDEAPNPEFDQEFTFTMRSSDLSGSVLQFTIWDVISNHETRVVGFFRVQLANYQKTLLTGADTGAICREIQPFLTPPGVVLGQLLISLLYDCVTDKILVTVCQCKQLAVTREDIDIYLKVSLLLDNDIIVSKRSNTFNATKNLNISQSFEFLTLSDELDKISTESSTTLRVADELITNASPNYKKSLVIKDVKSVRDAFASDTLRNHMGVLMSVRATTGSSRSKRVIGRLYLGKTNFPNNDEEFHWVEMVRNFDNTMTQWHNLRLDRL